MLWKSCCIVNCFITLWWKYLYRVIEYTILYSNILLSWLYTNMQSWLLSIQILAHSNKLEAHLSLYCSSGFSYTVCVQSSPDCYTPAPRRGRGVYCFTSVRPSKIFFVAFFSVTWWQKSDIWSQASYRYTILWVAFLDPSDSYFLFADLVGFYTHWTYMHIFSATIDGRDLIFGHKLHIGTPYRGKRFWTHQIPTSCLPTLLIFIHIEHICSFFVAFFSATIDGRNLIFGHKLHIGTPYRGKRFLTHQIPTSCLPKSGGIIGEH
jgi:hypothetical protein